MSDAADQLSEPRQQSAALLPDEQSLRNRGLGDVLGLLLILLVALAFLSPALKDGLAFGPTNIGRQTSIFSAARHSAPLIHNTTNGDVITQGEAWNTLDWELVHHGQLPLWNDESATGLPQFLNFESAPFALPTLIGYLFPLTMSYLVTILVKLLIAGTGTYVVTRLLGARVLPSTLAGVTMMLSGSFAGWLGWSISGPFAWTGWIIAAVILVYRAPPQHRTWRYLLLAVATAFSIYGGFPEAYVLMAGALSLLLAGVGVAKLANRLDLDWHGVGRIAVGLIAGFALSAPLWLPGIGILRDSVRTSEFDSAGLPLHTIALVVAQGYDGLPLATSHFPQGTFFGPADYFETAAYVGVVALTLGLLALMLAYRRPAIIGLFACAAGSALITYDLGPSEPIQHLIAAVGLGTVTVQRILSELGFGVAVLAGLGLESLLRSWRSWRTQIGFAISAGILGLVIGLLWMHSSVGAAPVNTGLGHLSAQQTTAVRRRSLIWPTAEDLALLGVALCLPLLARLSARRQLLAERRVRTLMGGLVVLQTVFLIVAGVGIGSFHTSSYPSTPGVSELKRVVGSSLFGLDGPTTPCTTHQVQPCGVRAWNGLGLYPEVNLGYGLTEFATHDPTTPRAFFDDYPVNHVDRNGLGLNLFVPSINSVALARLYGIRYVLVEAPQTIPAGMHLVKKLIVDTSTVDIVSVPDSHRFSFVQQPETVATQTSQTGSNTPATHANARILGVTHPSNSQYVLRVRVPKTVRLAIRITDVPGWHLSAEGHPVTLSHAAGDMMAATIPAGTRNIVLTYRPTLMVVGATLGVLTLIGLVAFGVIETRRRRDRSEGMAMPFGTA